MYVLVKVASSYLVIVIDCIGLYGEMVESGMSCLFYVQSIKHHHYISSKHQKSKACKRWDR